MRQYVNTALFETQVSRKASRIEVDSKHRRYMLYTEYVLLPHSSRGSALSSAIMYLLSQTAASSRKQRVCVSACVFVYVRVCMGVGCVCLYARLRACMSVCMSACGLHIGLRARVSESACVFVLNLIGLMLI